MGRSYMSFILQAAFTGVFIVAGPWLLSILNLSVLGSLLASFEGIEPGNLFAPIVYGYAFFLLSSVPIHYLFTRMAADYLYMKQERQVTRIMLIFLVPLILLGVLVSLVILHLADPGATQLSLTFRVGYVLFGIGINILWLVLIVVSLLRWHGRLLASFLLSLGLSVVILQIFGAGIDDIMLAFGLSNLIMALVLGILCLVAFPPSKIVHLGAQIRQTLVQSRFLLLAGWLYSLTLWAEKILYWITDGAPAGTLNIRLFEPYDFAVYLANLSLIPGMVFFVVYAETSYASSLRKFLNALDHQTYTIIQRTKHELSIVAKKQILSMIVTQGAVVILLVLLTPVLTSLFPSLLPHLWLMNLGIVFFQSLNVTLMNFLYYMNQFRRVSQMMICYFLLVVGFTLVERQVGLPYGLGALVGAGLVVGLLWWQLIFAIKHLDRIILTRGE